MLVINQCLCKTAQIKRRYRRLQNSLTLPHSLTHALRVATTLTAEARYLGIVREGHWQWVYDNINMYQRVRHEREGEKFMYLCLIRYFHVLLLHCYR